MEKKKKKKKEKVRTRTDDNDQEEEEETAELGKKAEARRSGSTKFASPVKPQKTGNNVQRTSIERSRPEKAKQQRKSQYDQYSQMLKSRRMSLRKLKDKEYCDLSQDPQR